MMKKVLPIVFIVFLLSCRTSDEEVTEPIEEGPVIYTIPVVVHVIHLGEPVGEGSNLSDARVIEQIASLNDDYRRREGTLGHNDHPDGGDAGIEFVLARQTPNGEATNGIVRINSLEVDNPVPSNSTFDYFAHFSYWSPESYLNIWTAPYLDLTDLFLGLAIVPETDLTGGDSFTPGEPFQAEGVIINAGHFGKSESSSTYNLGRTLTHEIGHYLGLLHPWGKQDCEFNDYCDDIPSVDKPVTSCTVSEGCEGEEVQVQNFMNWTSDSCMNMFTNDPVYRMRYALGHSPRRKSLLSSRGLDEVQ